MSGDGKVVSFVAAREASEKARLTAPDRDLIVAFLEQTLEKARKGDVWVLGIVSVERPQCGNTDTAWGTTIGFRGIASAPITFLGGCARLLGMAERDTAGLPISGDDVPGNPSPVG